MKNRKIIILLGLLFAAMIFFEGMALEEEMTLEELVITYLALGRPQFYSEYVLDILQDLLPIFVAEICFGTWIYRHYCDGAAYYFSRLEKRSRWFLLEALRMVPEVVLFFAGYELLSVAALYFYGGVTWTKAGTVLLICNILLDGLYVSAFACLINILAIRLGSQMASIAVIAFQSACTGVIMLFETRLSIYGNWSFLWKFNPVFQLILSWHSPGIWKLAVDNLYTTEEQSVHFPPEFSLVYLLLCNAVVIVAGCIFVEHQDVGLENKEEQI